MNFLRSLTVYLFYFKNSSIDLSNNVFDFLTNLVYNDLDTDLFLFYDIVIAKFENFILTSYKFYSIEFILISILIIVLFIYIVINIQIYRKNKGKVLDILLTFYEFNKQEISQYQENLTKFDNYLKKTFIDEEDEFIYSDISSDNQETTTVEERILNQQSKFKKFNQNNDESICNINRPYQ